MSVCALTLLMFINICIWYILHGGEAYYIGCSDCGDDNVKQPANDRLGLKKKQGHRIGMWFEKDQ